METQLSLAPALPATLEPTIGNFRLVRRLGRGGMGEVWLAEHQTAGTFVAVKLLDPLLAVDSNEVRRFFNEARAVARIRHAGIAKIFDLGRHGDRAYMIMEFLEGETIGQRLARVGKLPLPEALELGRQIASVLEATHSAQITHRDLKPDNVFVVPDRELACGERVKVLDFGIAKLTGTLAGGSRRTMGAMGTPAYMAPEQWGDPEKLDGRVDLYALGCMLFELVCGRPPFQPASVAEACACHLHDTPPRARTIVPALPLALDQLIAALLAKDPAARPASMREVGRTLERIARDTEVNVLAATAPHVAGEPRRRRRAPLAIGGVAVVAAAVVAGVMVRGTASEAAVADAPDVALLARVAAEPVPVRAVRQVEPPPEVVPAYTELPAVRTAPPAAPVKEGKIDEPELANVLMAHARQFHDCYAPHAQLDPSLTGRIVVTFTIGLDGRASNLSANGMTDVISGCVLAQVRAITFPRPIGGPVPVTYPISFSPVVTSGTRGSLPAGENDSDLVRLQALDPQLRSCAARFDVHGKVIATLNTGPDGSFTSLAIDRGLDETPFGACVRAVLHDVRFSAAEATDKSFTVPLSYP